MALSEAGINMHENNNTIEYSSEKYAD